MIATVSDSGLVNDSKFIDYLQYFISFVKPTKEEPFLIILGNHESQVTWEHTNFFENTTCSFLATSCILENTVTGIEFLQFTENGIQTSVNSKMINYPGKRIIQYEIGELFTNANNETINISKAVSGFRVAGNHPFDTGKFKECFKIARRKKVF